MRTILKFLSCFGLIVGLTATGAIAAQPGAVVQLNSIAELISPTHDYSSTPQVSISGYYSNGDGGDGIWQQETCTPDTYKARCVTDGHSHTWKRTNPNGNLAQFGITAGSEYDWGVHGAGASDASPVIQAAQVLNRADGILTTHCNGMQLHISSNLPLASASSFTCDVVPGITNDSGGYVNLPGTIRVDHGVTITRQGDGASIFGAYILPYWYTSAPTNAQQGFVALDNMLTNGDTGLFCDQQACNDYDLTIIGFDTGYEAINSPDLSSSNINIDADVCMWFTSTGGSTDNKGNGCFTYLTRSVPGPVRTQDYSITAITNDGGLCKVAVTATAPNLITDIQYANYVFIARLTSTSASCNGNGPQKISNLSIVGSTATFDLIGSSVTGMVGGNAPFGNWSSGSKVIYVSDVTNASPGNIINGLDAQGIPTGTTVAEVWGIPKITFPYTAATGSANTYSVNSGTNAPCDLEDGVNSYWTPSASNTSASTLNVSLNTDPNCSGGSTGALPIVRPDGSPLLANDLISGKHTWVIYSSTLGSWVLHKPRLVLSTKTQAAQTTPIATPLANSTCSPCGANAQAIISVALRIDAGTSPGGIAAGGLLEATGYLVGGPSSKDLASSNKTAGMSCEGCSVFDHSNFVHIQNSNETAFNNIHTDSQGETDNRSQIIFFVDGQVNNAHISGTKATKGGILVNSSYPNSPDRGCVTVLGTSIAPTAGTLPVADVEQGCLQMIGGVTNSAGVVFVANTALAFDISSYIPNLQVIFEGDPAKTVTLTQGSNPASGANNSYLVTSTASTSTSSSTTSITTGFVFWPCDASSNNVPLQLPDSISSENYNFQIYRKDAATSGFACHITTQSGQTIGGHTDWWLNNKNSRLAVGSDGTTTWVIQ